MLVYSGTDARKKGMGGLCTLSSKKKRPFIGDKKFFEHFGFKAVDEAGDYELLALTFDGGEFVSTTILNANSFAKLVGR